MRIIPPASLQKRTKNEERDKMQGPLILNRYRRLEYKGTGASGMVEICWDTRIQRRVAIKRMPASITEHEGTLPAGLKEARTGAMLSHPSIVNVLDFDVEGDYAYLIMEAIDGPSLGELIAKTPAGDMDLDVAASVATSIGQALDFAHENQVLHLDIKPDNILITRTGVTKVSDFGIAELADAQGFGEASGGTIGYMPPEQMRGEPLDQRCDEFAYAAVVYETLAGRNPFVAPTIDASIKLIEQGGFATPSELRDDVGPELDEVLLAALSPQREDRYETIYDFMNALLPLLGNAARGTAKLRAALKVADDGHAQERPSPRKDLWDAIPPRVRLIASRALTAALCWMPCALGLSAFDALDTPTALVASLLAAAAGAAKPVFGGVLALAVLSIGMICSPHASPAAGIALLAVTVAWAAFLAHEGIGNDEQDANVNCTLLALPLSMAGLTPLAWLVAGFCLPVRRAAVASAVASLCCLLLSIATGTGTLARSGLSLIGNGPSVAPASILASTGTWVMIVGCVLSTFLMSALCSRATRVSSIIGSIAASAALVTTQVLAQWLASGSWALPDPTWLIGDIAAITVMIVVGALGAPYRDKGEE